MAYSPAPRGTCVACSVGAPHLDFRDQGDEPRRFCASTLFQPLLRARLPIKKVSCAARRHPVSPAQRKKILSCAQEANFACENAGCGAPRRHSLKVARLEDDTGTSLDPLPRAPVVSDWQRRDGGGATRVGRCGEGDSGSQRPNSDAPSADEMTASSRRTRWRHRGEPGTRGRGAHGKFVEPASGKPRRQLGVRC